MVCLVALARLPQTLPVGASLSVLAFLLIAVLINARCAIPVPRERWRLAPNESLILLALLLFGGEAAVLLAAVMTLSLALRASKNWLNLVYVASLTVIITALLVVLQLSYGPVGALNQTASLYDYASLLLIAVPLQTVSRFVASGQAEGFFIVEERRRA